MMSILPHEQLPSAFDQLGGCLRPLWEAGPPPTDAGRAFSGARTTSATTAIHAHLHYLDLVPELLDACSAIENRRLLLNTDSPFKAAVIQRLLSERGEQNVVVRVCPNRGRDLAPMLLDWRDEIQGCELLIHCHTKKTPHAPTGFGLGWQRSLLRATFPDQQTCKAWQALLQNPEGGVILPWPHRFVAHNVNWGRNFVQTRQLLAAMGWPIERQTFLYFPAGSFFWARVDALRPLFSLGLRPQDFAPEPMAADGHLAHALERCFGLVPMLQNRHNYASWMGDAAHAIAARRPEPCLVALPRHDDVANLVGTWFDDGLQRALESHGPRDQALALGALLATA
jgi:lipopolysaccharide biosynthesis protein